MSFVSTKLGPALVASPYPQAITGLDLASEAYLLAQLLRSPFGVGREQPKSHFVRITPDLKSGLTLKQNIEFFLGEAGRNKIVWFSPHDALPYTGIVTGTDTAAERVSALKRLIDNDSYILVVPWQAVLRKIIPPSILKKYQRTLYLKEEIQREELVGWLIDSGYRREVVVESPGDFTIRGALIDIYPPQEEYPSRLEFDGDVLVGIRFFDPATQTSIKTRDLNQITLIPASEILFFDEFCRQALSQIKKFSDELDLPATVRREAAEKIESKRNFTGIETFLPAFYEAPATLLDYLKPDSIIFSLDLEELKEGATKFKDEIQALYQTTKSIERLIATDHLLNSFETLQGQLKKHSQVWMNPLLTLDQTDIPHHILNIENSLTLKNKWSVTQLKNWRREGLQTRLICHTTIQAERLQDLLRTQGVQASSVEIGKLSHGFGWMEESLIILTEEEIFGHKTIRRIKPAKAGIPFTTFSEMKVGDYLVHEEHGINRYKGLVHLKIQGIQGDYLQLEFLGGDKLYLPIYRLNAVQRYIGGSPEHSLILDKLGGIRWQRIKKRAGEQVYKIAQELLKIHAQRELHPGLSYPPPDTLDEEFASHFPYDETPDQAQAIEDVFRDMQKSKPMDRLICGDVGYGKTEVAMRAAFKAVNSGKQVALLVPTTILALQHFETFQERFSKIAISVEMFSRFRSRSEQKEALAKLSAAKLDIVIGTHRLLMPDVKFKQLGLLIIDEEHRFGVRHKEKIKKLRPTVDVLTLSATPIPRTLHMSLIGLRDLSMIHTPPVDRISIRTFIAKWDNAVVRHAIEQELARGGQVFFVHNRVATIVSAHKRLCDLFPEATIAVAHGQMKENDLERVMIAFLHQKTQILLTTTIIESGIDVPNANTIIINRADTFGLAQLYQLRGRVGRSDRQAYCYLLVPDEETLTGEAKQRLAALTRYTELGAGFQIASHDLEIRGTGNLLGTAQAGFIEEIGYELYTKLLARTIRKLKGEKIEEEIDPEIHLKIPAFIPESYVSDTTLRMELYKRMSHLSNDEETKTFGQELLDRFGPLPAPVSQLLDIISIKQLATQLRLRSIQFDGRRFVINWDRSTPIDPKILIRLAQEDPEQYQLKPSGVMFVRSTIGQKNAPGILLAAKNLLRGFLECVSPMSSK